MANITIWNFLDSYFNTEMVYQKLDSSPDSGFMQYATVIMIIVILCSVAFLVFQELLKRSFMVEEDDDEPESIDGIEKHRDISVDRSADEEIFALVCSRESFSPEKEVFGN